MRNSLPYLSFKPSIRRSPEGSHESFSLKTVDGVAIKGAMTCGYINGTEGFLLEFLTDEHEYRWVFQSEISSAAKDLILAALRHDPAYREQFRKPAVPAKEADLVALSDLISRAFGEHQIASSGTVESTAHSWEKTIKVILGERMPAEFATFARKCPFLKLGKVRRQDCITVATDLGNAYQANTMFMKVVSDFVEGKLGRQADYAFEVKRINPLPSKPTITSTKQQPTAEQVAAQPSLNEQILQVKNSGDPQSLLRNLMFLKPGGRDEFSTMKLEDMQARIKPADLFQIEKRFKKVDERLKCMRWHLRGLPIKESIMKIEVDRETSQRFADRASASREFDRYVSRDFEPG